MNNEQLLLIKKHRDTQIEQTKSTPQETLGITLNRQMETFSFSPKKNLAQDGNWLLEVTRSETTNSVFITSYENESFSTSVAGHWSSRGGADFI